MIQIKVFGALRLTTGIRTLQLDAKNVRQAIQKIASAYPVTEKALKECVVMVNGERRTMGSKLNDGDELFFLSPAGGG